MAIPPSRSVNKGIPVKDVRGKMAKDNLPNIDELSLNDLNALIQRAESLRQKRQDEVKASFLNEMRSKAAQLGLDIEVGVGKSGRRKRSDAGVKLAAKFVGPNGETYTGRGPTPKWLKDLEAKGHNRDRYLAK
jgi:DNA-binding protein H-NS